MDGAEPHQPRLCRSRGRPRAGRMPAARRQVRDRAAGLPLQPARRRPGGDQLRRRQHLGQARRARSDHRRADRGAVGEGLGRRPRLDRRRRFRAAAAGDASRRSRRASRARPTKTELAGLYPYAAFEPGSARALDRYAAARPAALRPCRPRAPRRGDRAGGLLRRRGGGAGDLRRGGRLDAVAAARLRAGAAPAGAGPDAARPARRDHGRPRPDLAGATAPRPATPTRST